MIWLGLLNGSLKLLCRLTISRYGRGKVIDCLLTHAPNLAGFICLGDLDLMKVILQQNVPKLGKAGDIVEASNGYFRNFLQPRSLAVLATPGAMKKREEDVEVLRKKAEKAHQEALGLCQKITDHGLVRIGAKAGEGGKLYGKITNKEVAAAIQKACGIEVDKRLIKLLDDIGALGTYRAVVKLATDAQAEINVEVVMEGMEDKVSKPVKPVADAEPVEEEGELAVAE